MGGFLAAARSSREAWALNERSFKRLLCVQRVKGDKVKRGQGIFVFTRYLLGNLLGVAPRFHLTKLIKIGT